MIWIRFWIEADDANEGADALGEAAEHAKLTGASLFGHAKGAAAAAIAAGSKTAEEIADQKLKEAENVMSKTTKNILKRFE